MISCFDPLAEMTIFLNRPTDVAALKNFVDHRVEETRTRRKEILGDTWVFPKIMVPPNHPF